MLQIRIVLLLPPTQQDTGFQRSARSDAEGKYQFPYLPPGPYTRTAQLAGFKIIKREGIIANAGAQLRVDLVLAPGDVTEQVTVVADAPSMGFQWRQERRHSKQFGLEGAGPGDDWGEDPRKGWAWSGIVRGKWVPRPM
jgi:hypothetical protein